MSTVKLTSYVQDEIITSLKTLFQARLNPLREKMANKKMATHLYEHAFTAEERKLMDMLPRNWLVKEETLYYTLDIGAVGKCSVDRIPVSVAGPWYVPITHKHHALFTAYTSSERKIVDPRIGMGKTLFLDVVEEYIKVQLEEDKLVLAAKEMFKHCKTLNQLTRVWPKVADYVSKETCEKLYRSIKKTREKVKTVFEDTVDESTKATLLKAEIMKEANTST